MDFWGGGGGGGFADDPDNEDNDEGQSTNWEVGRDGLIFLIDASSNMHTKSQATGESAFELCLKCARNVLMNKIISSERDLIGLVLYGTETSNNVNDFSHITIAQELDMPDAKRILELEEYMNDSAGDKYGQSDDFSLTEALWTCSNVFAGSSMKLQQKRVLLFTNSDDPHQTKPEEKRRAIQKAKDLSELDILVDLMHLTPEHGQFDIHRFYRDIVTHSEDEDLTQLENAAEKFDELLTRVRRKENTKRAVTSLPFILADGIKLSVSVYALCRPAKKPSAVKLDSGTNEELKVRTKYICKDTGQELLPTDMKYYQMFGGEKIIFEKEEVDSIRNILPKGIHLLGFKPLKYLKPYYHVKGANFIFPDEKSIIGSTTLFSALLTRSLARNVTPICTIVPRDNAAPRIAALLPQSEQLDENNFQVRPAGFHIIYLPFADDIRKVKVDPMPKASDEQIIKFKEVLDKLKFTYSSEMFENPSLQTFFRHLEAFALDREDVEEYKDLTTPNMEAIDRKAGEVIKELQELVFPAGYDATSVGGAKRKAPASGEGTSKKPKVEMVDVDVAEVARKGGLHKLTVATMKIFCQTNKLKASSQKKADLMDAIKQFYNVA